MPLLEMDDPARGPEAPAGAGPAPLDPALYRTQGADLHLAWTDPGLRARASLWFRQAPAWPGERLGLIGHFAAADGDAAGRLLEGACARLARAGCTLALGPMDGTTWRSYRLVTRAGVRPPFFLEPWNPAEYPLWWREAGFRSFAGYRSELTGQLEIRDPRLARARARMASAGLSLRPLDSGDFEAELARIHQVSMASFRRNLLFSPLDLEAFRALYRPVKEALEPRLSWMAEQEGRPVGYIFTLPDRLQARRGEEVDTVIVKTCAVLPERAWGGLGKLLLATSQQEAHALGYRWAIHALMHERNVSTLLGEATLPLREYVLFARDLR